MGSAFDQLTEKQQLFVAEYAISMDRKTAVEKAGYKGTTQSMHNRALRLLSDPKVQAAIAEVGTRLDGSMLTIDNLATQLARFIFRNMAPFVDAEGYLKCSVADLPEDIQQAVEGFDVDNEYDPESGELVRQKVKLRFVPKAKGIELAMRWKQMLAPAAQQINIQNTVSVDWSKFYEKPTGDVIQERMDKALNGPETSENDVEPKRATKRKGKG